MGCWPTDAYSLLWIFYLQLAPGILLLLLVAGAIDAKFTQLSLLIGGGLVQRPQ